MKLLVALYSLTIWPGVVVLTGCATHTPAALHSPPHSVVVVSGGMNHSASYLAHVDGGVIVVDLGWWGAGGALQNGLRQLDAKAEDVIAVFLTHSHRDHIGAWRKFREVPFHLATEEVDLLLGRQEHGGWIPRWAAKIKRADVPNAEEVDLRAFHSDTTFVFGTDSVHAFMVPGHTAGSAAYLFRGTLYAGDAISHTWWNGFRVARGGYSADVVQARRSLESLRRRISPYRVERICSAHLKCAEVTEELWADLLEK